MRTLLFACVHNAGRSQMAAAWARTLGAGKVEVISAGTQPETRIHPAVVEAMAEVGIDLSEIRPQLLTEEIARRADILITMGCGEACPYVPGLRRLDWPLADPKDKDVAEVRRIRDEVRGLVQTLLHSLLT